MTWKERGEFIYKGTTIQGSHIVDLLKNTQYHHNNYTPLGTNTFYKGPEYIYIYRLRLLSSVTLRYDTRAFPLKRKENNKEKSGFTYNGLEGVLGVNLFQSETSC